MKHSQIIMSTATPGQRSKRKTQIGFVSSRSGDKSVKVTIAYKTPHPLYQKVVNRQTVLHVHDEKNETKVGDKVEVMETRPLSRLKRWRVVRSSRRPSPPMPSRSPRPMSPRRCRPRPPSRHRAADAAGEGLSPF